MQQDNSRTYMKASGKMSTGQHVVNAREQLLHEGNIDVTEQVYKVVSCVVAHSGILNVVSCAGWQR